MITLACLCVLVATNNGCDKSPMLIAGGINKGKLLRNEKNYPLSVYQLLLQLQYIEEAIADISCFGNMFELLMDMHADNFTIGKVISC